MKTTYYKQKCIFLLHVFGIIFVCIPKPGRIKIGKVEAQPRVRFFRKYIFFLENVVRKNNVEFNFSSHRLQVNQLRRPLLYRCTVIAGRANVIPYNIIRATAGT